MKRNSTIAALSRGQRYIRNINEHLLLGVDRNFLAVTSQALIAHSSVGQRKKRIISAAPDICSGMYLCSALGKKNVSRQYELTVGTFHAKSF
jgi:hypothetical protein